MAGVGALQQGGASAAASEYNAEMGWQNAQVARQAAKDEAAQASREHYLRLGDMQVAIGASGGVGGSFLDVLGDTASQMELERQNIIYAGSVKANLLAHGASLADAAASSARTGGYLRAAGALLGGNYDSPRRAGSTQTGASESFGMTGNEL